MKPFLNSQGSIVAGTIHIWVDDISNLPPGWVLCDGNNGTSDLTGKFPKSVLDSSTNPGSTVGQNSKTISENQLPSHTHSGSTGNSTIDHNHSISTDEKSNQFDEVNYATSGNDETSSSSHSHPLNIGSTGGSSDMENKPPYYEVAFVTKI